MADIAAQHVGDDNLGEVDVGDASEAGVVEVLGEPGVSAAGHENLRARGRFRFGDGDLGNERVTELGPLGVPLEWLVGASDGEELVPVLLAGEVPQGA